MWVELEATASAERGLVSRMSGSRLSVSTGSTLAGRCCFHLRSTSSKVGTMGPE